MSCRISIRIVVVSFLGLAGLLNAKAEPSFVDQDKVTPAAIELTREFEDKIKISVQRSGLHNRLINQKAKLLVNHWGDEKVMVLFTIKASKQCSSVEKMFIGYGTAFNTYDLYLKDIEHPKPTPATSTSVGDLIMSDQDAHIRLIGGFQAKVKGSYTGTGDDCNYEISPDTAIILKNKKKN